MDWIQGFETIIALVVVGLIVGLISWIIRSKREESQVMRIKLDEERRKAYSEILSPFIRVLANVKGGEGATKAVKTILSEVEKFQKNRLDLTLFGSDNVVRAHNAFWEYAYKGETDENKEQRGITFIMLWGKLLLEIRKDVGNKKTQLDERDMIKWLIKDIDRY